MTRAALGLTLLVACGTSPARTRIDEQKLAVPAPAAAGWTCPMHPEVHAATAGPCPICGMPLVESK